ncbi:MAG: hypothetical protein ACE5HA_06370 [Anaerolineae bacterium]
MLTSLRRGSVTLIFATLLMLASNPAAAQTPASDITWSAKPLFGGVVKYGEWLPIRVTLSSQGSDRTVEVRAVLKSTEGQATFVRPVELPAGARKQITLYVTPNTFSRRLRLSLMAGSDELDRATIDVQPVAYRVFLIGIVAPNRDTLSILGTVPVGTEPARTVAFDLDEVPDRAAGLGSFDALVFNDVDTSQLSSTQRLALNNWVHLGGHLVVGGGAGAATTAAGLPADLLPVSIEGTKTVDELPGLSGISEEPVSIAGPFVVARTTNRSGGIMAGQDDTPLIVQARVGEGRVTFVALDLGTSPFGAWAGERAMWTMLLQPDNDALLQGPPDVSPRRWADGQMIGALSNLPSLDLPSVRWVVVLLAIYILLVGPANYVLLRRVRRLEWAWITIPAMTLTFSLAAYGAGYGLRGGEVILNKLSIIEVMPGADVARVRTYAGLFSPTRRAYTLTLDGDPLISLLNPNFSPWDSSSLGGNITVVQGQPTQVRELAINQWSMQTFMADTVVSAPVNVKAELTYTDGRIRGRVVNAGSQPLRDMVLVMSGEVSRLDTIAAGDMAEVDLRIDTKAGLSGPPISYLILQDVFQKPEPTGLDREIRLKQQMLDSLFASPYETGNAISAGPLLIAWLDRSPTAIRVEGLSVRELGTSLVIARPALRFGDRDVSVPSGFVPAHLIDQDGGVSPCFGPQRNGFAFYQSKVTLDFSIPSELYDVDFNYLDLILATDGGWGQPPTTALYDWEAGAWHVLDNVKLGANPIDNANRFISANSHTVRVQMEAGDDRGGCVYADIALEGVRVETKVKE